MPIKLVWNYCRLLCKQINLLLDVFKIESGRMKVVNNYFNAGEIIHDLQEMFEVRNTIDNRKLEILTNIPNDQYTLFSDEGKIRHVLTNLMDNAYKYTDEGFIEVGFKPEEDEVTFFVKDSGIGINEDQKPVISNWFTQAGDNDSRVYSGEGFGLFISASLVKLLGGIIVMESKENEGAYFGFTIPVLSPSGERVISFFKKSEVQKELSGRKILVVDPNTSSNHLVKKILEHHEVTFSFMSIEEVAGKNFQDCSSCDLLLLDIKQEGGFHFLEQIKKQISGLKVLTLAKDAKFADKQEAYLHGADDFIPKPLMDESLLMKICKLLKKD